MTNSIEIEILKLFFGLTEENKKRILDIVHAMATMDINQSKEYRLLQEKLQEKTLEMNEIEWEAYLDFLIMAAQRVLNGETCAQLWQYWQSPDNDNALRYDKELKEATA